LDGTIDPERQRDIDVHLKTCDACADRYRRAAAALEGTATLPRSIDPPADLWPAIRNRIDQQRVVEAPFAPSAHSTRARRWPLLGGGGGALVVISSAITTLIVRRSDTPPLSNQPIAAALAPVTTVEAEYIRATEELMTQLEARRSRLSPATVRV